VATLTPACHHFVRVTHREPMLNPVDDEGVYHHPTCNCCHFEAAPISTEHLGFLCMPCFMGRHDEIVALERMLYLDRPVPARDGCLWFAFVDFYIRSE
jgi:hypothetical protein